MGRFDRWSLIGSYRLLVRDGGGGVGLLLTKFDGKFRQKKKIDRKIYASSVQ